MSNCECCSGTSTGPTPLVNPATSAGQVRNRRLGVEGVDAARRELVALASLPTTMLLPSRHPPAPGVALGCHPEIPPVGPVNYPPGLLMRPAFVPGGQ
jgi:hypothetical protein